MSDLSDRIESVAGKPARMKGDAGEVELPNLADLVKADQHLASVGSSVRKTRGIRFTKLIPPGQTGSTAE